MTKRKLLVTIVAAALCLLVRIPSVYAGAIQLTDVSQLTPGGTVVTYPSPFVDDPNSFDIAAGGLVVNFATAGLFTVIDSDGLSFDFPAGTTLLVNNLQRGPLTITFSTGIQEFGLFAQSLALDLETFTFDVHHGSSTTSFSAGPADNSGLPGVALFLGARGTNGDLIDQVVIGEAANNDFVVGPLTFVEAAAGDQVPEPASLLLLGTGLLAAVRLRKRQTRG